MIEVLKYSDLFCVKQDKITDDCWINVISPEGDEIDDLCKRYFIPDDFFLDSLDPDEIARFDVEDDNYLIILRIPIKISTEDNVTFFKTVPLGIILNSKVIITISSGENELIDFFSKGEIKNFNPKNRKISILQIFNKTIQLYTRYLKYLGSRINQIENDLKVSMKNDELIKLFELEKNIIQFRASLKSNDRLFQKLQKSSLRFNEDEIDLLEDIMIDNKQAVEMADIYSNILNEMMSFFSSLISNNLNIVMKFLTSVTIILAIPTLFASIYGMNVQLPFQDSPYAFTLTMLLALLAAISVAVFFIFRKWL